MAAKKRLKSGKKAAKTRRISGVHTRARAHKTDERPQKERTESGQVSDAPAAEKNPVGRPTKFTPQVAGALFELAKLGYTDKEMAAAIDVAESTLNEWKKERPDFFEQLKGAKAIADDQVERSLFERATGYNHAAVKIQQYEGTPVITPFVEHCPPDVEAQRFWLKNRRPDKWRDKVEMDVTTDFAQKLIRARERHLAKRKASGTGTRRRAD